MLNIQIAGSERGKDVDMLKMFSRIKIGSLELKNRLGMSPMGTNGDAACRYTEAAINYFAERAKGGMGLIITGMNACSDKYEAVAKNVLQSVHDAVPLSELVDKVHFSGAKLIVQIGPGLGRLCSDPFSEAYSSSENERFFFPGRKCKVLTVEDIDFLVERMARTAKLCQETGADGVEIHAYGGYLLDQFFTPCWNHRTDEYGGSLENRMRFCLRIIDAIRDACGKDFVLGIKYTVTHEMDIEGTRSIDEGVEMAKVFEKAGLDFLHLDTGCYEVWNKQITTVYEEHGCQLHAARAVRKAVNLPLFIHGKLNDPVLAEKVLNEGLADVILMGHQSLADPYYANKVKSGKLLDIRPCIGCNECLYSSFSHRDKTCAINVCCYHENEYKLTQTSKGGRVLVVGGGPGGMNAAICAAERGFDVSLWERSDKLGGLLLAAGAPTFKQDVMNYARYLERQVLKAGVDVRLLKEAKAEDIIAGRFDHVILAYGAKPIMPPIPGIEKPNVIDAVSALKSGKRPHGNVVVIGGGEVGLEAACHFAQTAAKVYVIEMMPDVLMAAKHSRNNDQALRALVDESGIEVLTSAKVTAINDDGISYIQGEKPFSIGADIIVIAAGFKSVHALFNDLCDRVDDLHLIGDAVSSRKVYYAVHEGYHAVRLMD